MGTSVSLDRDFLRRVRRSTLIVGLVLAFGAFVLGGNKGGLAWVAGVGLSLLNLLAIEWILGHLLKPTPNIGLKLGAVFLVKVPVIFGLIYLFVGPLGLPVDWFAYGFALLFAVFLLKALAVVMLSAMGIRISDSPRGRRSLRGAPKDGSVPPPNHSRNASGQAIASSSERRRRARTVGLIAVLVLLVSPFLPRLVSHQDGWVTSLEEQPSVAIAQHETPSTNTDSHGNTAPDAHGAATAQAQDPHGATTHPADAHGADAHGEGEDHGPVKHFPNLMTYITAILAASGVDHSVTDFLTKWENVFFALLAASLLGGAAFAASRNAQMIPGRLQNAVEYAVEGYYDFVRGILGKETRRYIPFVGTLFFYIWAMNWMGLVPGGKSPTSYLNTTAALAICVFLFVQYTGLTRLGPKKYLLHLAGDPSDAVGWGLVPLMLPLHIIGELAKPLSLALRLFGNIMGEDTLLALFAMLVVIPIPHLHVGVPFHLPFMFLALLASTIQALVFSLLATIYLSQVLPHGHEEEHGHGHEVAHAH